MGLDLSVSPKWFEMKSNWVEVKKLVSSGLIRHVSFDFWNTIAYSNPEFKVRRANFLCDFLGENFEQIDNHVKQFASRYNLLVESGEYVKSPDVLYHDLIFELSGKNLDNEEVSRILNVVNQLFIKYPPVITDEILDLLKWLKSVNCTLSITSNTAFVSGNVILNLLEELNLNNLFDFFIFSDQLGFAKPNDQIYQELIRQVFIITGSSESNKILHIGDDYKNDILGAQKHGINTFHIQ